jgi:hypothetical protein
LRRTAYLLSRVAGVLTVVAMAAALAFLTESGTRLVRGGEVVPWGLLLNVLAVALTTCSLLVLFGSFTRAYFNVAIYLLLSIGLSGAQGILALVRSRGGRLGEFLHVHPEIESAVTAIDLTLFPDPSARFDGQWLARSVVVAAVALALACALFNRREVPYGAD